MKKLLMVSFLFFISTMVYSQSRIKTPMMMLIQVRIPIQPDDKSWVNWYATPSLQDSTKTIRIDRRAQGFSPFIARHDAPYYSSAQVKEIQLSLERILNPDGYFATQEEFRVFYQEFLDKFVYKNVPERM